MALGGTLPGVGRTRRTATAGACVAATVAVLSPPVAVAEPDGIQHNITYRARVDGLARGALISYRISDEQVTTADPTMLPGRTFEATAVLSDPDEAGMRISIQWPYSANLTCEILVDEGLVAQASQFIAPRLTPARDDPDYGALNCGAPLTNAVGLPGPPPEDPAAPAPEGEAVPLPVTAERPPN